MRNAVGYFLGFLIFVAQVILLTLQVRSEQKRLVAEFGDEYRDYKKSVPRYLLKK